VPEENPGIELELFVQEGSKGLSARMGLSVEKNFPAPEENLDSPVRLNPVGS
jgi:hypothetical protein